MNPLDQLLPPIEPEAIGWWPPAPGWWLLLIVLLATGAVFVYRRYRKTRITTTNSVADNGSRIRTEALLELQALHRPYTDAPAGPWLQAINSLLKRLCRERYPESNSHTLSQRAWLAFLDGRCPAAGLTRWLVLVEGAYQPDCRLSDEAIDDLNRAIEIWIEKHV